MIERALILDVETTSLDPSAGKVIEIGAILYSVANQTPLASFAALLPAEENPAENVNRIPAAGLREVDGLQLDLKGALALMRSHAQAIVAHNAEFDRSWMRGDWLSLPWLCTMQDFEWPLATRSGGSLVHLALEHGIGVSSAHRALTDCQLIAALFDRQTDLPAMFARAMRPKGIFQALVSFDEKDLAKDAGFKWDPPSKRWTRRMAIADAAALPFRTQLLQEVA